MNNKTWFDMISESNLKNMATRAVGIEKRTHFQNLGNHRHLGPLIVVTGTNANNELLEVILSQYGVVSASPKEKNINEFNLKTFLRENFEKNFPFRSVEYKAEKSFLDDDKFSTNLDTIEKRWLVEMYNATKGLKLYNQHDYFETYKEYHKAPILQEALESSQDSFKNALYHMDARINKLGQNFKSFVKQLEQDNTPTA